MLSPGFVRAFSSQTPYSAAVQKAITPAVCSSLKSQVQKFWFPE